MPTYCTHCGTALTPGTLFCPGCGAKTVPATTPNAAPEIQPDPVPQAQPVAPQYGAPPPQMPFGQPPPQAPFGQPPASGGGNALQNVPGLSALPPAMRLPALGIVVLLALGLLGKMFGHSGTPNPGQTGTTNPFQGGTASPAQGGAAGGGSGASAQAGVFSGMCTTEAGTPLANIDIKVVGLTSAGVNTEQETHSDASGAYSVSMPPGSYSIGYALCAPTLGSTTYTLPLTLKDGENNDPADIGPGVVRNLVLHIHGKIAPSMDDTEWQSFYGGHIRFVVFGRYELSGLPAGSITELTLVPEGPLVDGTTGQTLVLHGTYPTRTNKPMVDFLDIPIGQYTITARLLNADGSLIEPLIIGPAIAYSDPAPYKPSIEGLTFPPLPGQSPGIGRLELSLNDGG